MKDLRPKFLLGRRRLEIAVHFFIRRLRFILRPPIPPPPQLPFINLVSASSSSSSVCSLSHPAEVAKFVIFSTIRKGASTYDVHNIWGLFYFLPLCPQTLMCCLSANLEYFWTPTSPFCADVLLETPLIITAMSSCFRRYILG